MKWMANCTECSWEYEAADQVDASDAVDRHARKERHHVNIQRNAAASA